MRVMHQAVEQRRDDDDVAERWPTPFASSASIVILECDFKTWDEAAKGCHCALPILSVR